MDPRPGAAVGLCLLLCLAPVAGVGVATAQPTFPVQSAAGTGGTALDAASGQSSQIEQTTTLSLTPDRPGTVAVRVGFDLPSSLTELDVRLPEGATVRDVDGFERTDERRLSWDGETDAPAVVFRYEVNQSAAGGRASDVVAGPTGAPSPTARTSGTPETAGAATDGYAFADAGPWAITRVPRVAKSWSWSGGGDVDVVTTTAVDGEGAAGDGMAYLGPMTEHVREANGATFRLVVPEAADLSPAPDAVLGALVNASGLLTVGARDPSVLFVAAPTTVDWGSAGLSYGGSDAWVRADAPLETAGNVWLHEYVHTRQAYEPTEATRWTVEASAEYYAALLALRLGLTDFEGFERRLERGATDRYAEGVLADPGTWEGPVHYLKGALVFGQLDRRIRLAGDASAADLLARLNAREDPVTQRAFLEAVEASGDAEVAAYAREHTETDAVPSTWDRSAHREAFPEGPLVAYRLGDAVLDVSGPFRNRSLATGATVVTGESLSLSVPVTNEGTERARYELSLVRDGEAVARANGSVAPGETATATLTHELRGEGPLALVAGAGAGAGSTVRVAESRDPAPLRVTALSVTDDGGPVVAVTATVESAADRPAAGDLPLSVDGERRATRAVAVDAGEAATVTFEVSVDDGAREVSVGGVTRDLDRRSESPSTADGGTTASPAGGETTTGTAPLSPALAALAVVLAALALRFRRRRPGR